MSDDGIGNPEEEKERLLSRQRMLGVQFRMQYGIGDGVFEKELRTVFEESLLDAYIKWLNVDWNQKDADLARKFGPHRSTIGHWRKGQRMSLKEFVTVAAATNTEFPKGSMAGLEAYCKSFRYVQSKIGARSSDIGPDQALCLYHTIRSVEWQKGCDGDPAILQQAAQTICDYVTDLIPTSPITGVAEIQSTLAVRTVEWTILESVVTHDNWF